MRVDYDKDQLSYALANALKERDEARERERIAALVHKALYDTVERERDEAIQQIAKLRDIAERAIDDFNGCKTRQLRAELDQIKESEK